MSQWTCTRLSIWTAVFYIDCGVRSTLMQTGIVHFFFMAQSSELPGLMENTNSFPYTPMMCHHMVWFMMHMMQQRIQKFVTASIKCFYPKVKWLHKTIFSRLAMEMYSYIWNFMSRRAWHFTYNSFICITIFSSPRLCYTPLSDMNKRLFYGHAGPFSVNLVNGVNTPLTLVRIR